MYGPTELDEELAMERLEMYSDMFADDPEMCSYYYNQYIQGQPDHYNTPYQEEDWETIAF